MNDPNGPADKKPLTSKDTFNIVTDTVIGPNLRLKDNLYQGLAIFVSLVLGTLIGFLVAAERITGMVLGAFIGLVAGALGSGLFLMIYRLIKHSKGQHD